MTEDLQSVADSREIGQKASLLSLDKRERPALQLWDPCLESIGMSDSQLCFPVCTVRSIGQPNGIRITRRPTAGESLR